MPPQGGRIPIIVAYLKRSLTAELGCPKRLSRRNWQITLLRGRAARRTSRSNGLFVPSSGDRQRAFQSSISNKTSFCLLVCQSLRPSQFATSRLARLLSLRSQFAHPVRRTSSSCVNRAKRWLRPVCSETNIAQRTLSFTQGNNPNYHDNAGELSAWRNYGAYTGAFTHKQNLGSTVRVRFVLQLRGLLSPRI